MKTSLFMVAVALAAGLSATSWANENEGKGDCSKNDGICGCSYGRVMCCDGSYAPRHYRSGSGEIVYNGCTAPANAGAHASQIATPIPDYYPTPTNTRLLAPSQEMYWRGSVFDR